MTAGDFKNGANLPGQVLAQATVNSTEHAIYGPVPAATYVKLSGLVFCNEAATTRTLSYGVVKSGNTPGAAGTRQGKNLTLSAAGSSTSVIDADELDGFMLGPGDLISAIASNAGDISFTVSGAVSS